MTPNQVTALVILGVLWAGYLLVSARWKRMEEREAREEASYRHVVPLIPDEPEAFPFDWALEDADEATELRVEQFANDIAATSSARERLDEAKRREERIARARAFVPAPRL